jgi:hypothetical protein
MKRQPEGIIPVDGAVKEFEKHLKSHPRTILSARFGDGKSFFLAEAEKQLKRRYAFLTVYPVNYQVAENLDIFEYIKRDLLFQLYEKGIASDTYEIPDNIAAFFFLQNNWEEFAEEVLNTLSCFDSSNTIKATLGAVKFLKTVKKRYDEFKNNGGKIGARIDRFMAAFDDKGIYEEDPITAIICDIIKTWKKEHPRRRVCLVFEDMDRIDPAHIFRILNVISAHMDYSYKYGVSPKSSSLAGNKFGVHNIVVCLDFDNLKGIYHHFYGQKACFDGYINKFSDRGVFTYSLQEQVKQYYVNELVRVTGMEGKAVMCISEQFDITGYTLRQLYHAMEDIGSQISLPAGTKNIVPHRGLYIMAALLRRLGVATDEITDILSRAFHNHPVEIGAYAATSMMLRKRMISTSLVFTFGEKKDGYLETYEVTDCHHDGQAFIKTQLMMDWDSQEKFDKPEVEIEYIMGNVNK